MGSYFVTFAGRLDDECRAALTRAGLLLTGGHGGGTLRARGELPEIDHHTVRVADARTREEAAGRVESALEGSGVFGGFEAHPE